MMQALGLSICSFIACVVATESAIGQPWAAGGAPGSMRLVAQMTPSGKLLRQDELIDRVYGASSLREAQAAERARHQDAMEQIQAFQKRARERYNDDMKRCRDISGNECMSAAAARHRQASGESQRLHRREMDLYNHNLAVLNRVWAPEPRRDTSAQSPPHNDQPLDHNRAPTLTPGRAPKPAQPKRSAAHSTSAIKGRNSGCSSNSALSNARSVRLNSPELFVFRRCAGQLASACMTLWSAAFASKPMPGTSGKRT